MAVKEISEERKYFPQKYFFGGQRNIYKEILHTEILSFGGGGSKNVLLDML